MNDAVFILASEMPWVLRWQWKICVCVQHSIKLPVNEFVFNRAVRDGTISWFQVEGFCQMKSAVAWPDSTSRVLSRFACRVWGPGKPRFICKHRKGDLPLQFPAFKADVFNLSQNVFWDPWDWEWASGLGLLALVHSCTPFCWLSCWHWGLLWELIYY